MSGDVTVIAVKAMINLQRQPVGEIRWSEAAGVEVVAANDDPGHAGFLRSVLEAGTSSNDPTIQLYPADGQAFMRALLNRRDSYVYFSDRSPELKAPRRSSRNSANGWGF